MTYECPRCHEGSDDPYTCSECGAPITPSASAVKAMAAMQGAPPAMPGDTGVLSAARGAARTQVARAGGYAGGTVKATNARRPTAAGHGNTQLGTGTSTGTSRGTKGTKGSRGTKGTRSAVLRRDGGLSQMPLVPSEDPLLKVLSNPKVPASKCLCPNPACVDADNNRSIVDPNRRFCANCASEYNFTPALKAGDLVAGQYEVKGALALGGMGWLYLAQDRKVNDRWVVLKGLLNTKDDASAAAAVAERQFLASIKHARIVGIYNFVTHAGESYIVMEYVGGRTLKDIRKAGPLPSAHALTYILGVLPGFSYLHERGLVYCDFSADNMMVEGDEVKLIDLGATRRVGDTSGDFFGKPGYQAVEADSDPVPESDIFSIGRTLALMVMDMSMRLTGPIDWVPPDEVMTSLGIALKDIHHWAAALEGGKPLPDWLLFDPATHKFSGKAPLGIMRIAVQVSAVGVDGKPLPQLSGKPATVPFDIVLPLALPEPQDFRFEPALPPFSAAGLDVTKPVSWSVSTSSGSLPPWLKWNSSLARLTGKAPDGVTSVDVLLTGRDHTGRSQTLPFAVNLPFAQSESLYRLLLKATAYEADARFRSAEDFAGQIVGVVRELVGRTTSLPPADDSEFGHERALLGTDPASYQGAWRRLPDMRLDEADPARNEVFAAASAGGYDARRALLDAAVKAFPSSVEARLRLALLLVEQEPDGQCPEEDVMRLLDQVAAMNPWDWRADWCCGLMRLSLGQSAEAVECMDKVYGEVPGSTAPKLALAMALEQAGRTVEAAGLYDTASITDPSMTAGAFGLARCLVALGDTQGAVSALARVAESSVLHADAQLFSVVALSGNEDMSDIVQAGDILASMSRSDISRYVAEASLLLHAAFMVETGRVKPTRDARLLGQPFTSKTLRLRAELKIMACARLASTRAERVRYVDLAREARPWTLFW